MIIDSPVGRFPFTVTTISWHGRRVVMEGRMGTWPTRIDVQPRDLPKVLVSLSPSLGGGVVGALAVGVVGLLVVGARLGGRVAVRRP